MQSPQGHLDPLQVALRVKRETVLHLYVANGRYNQPAPPAASPLPALAVRAAWLPLLGGQAIPFLGERGVYADPYDID